MSDPTTPHGPRIEDRLRQGDPVNSIADLMVEAAQVIEMLRANIKELTIEAKGLAVCLKVITAERDHAEELIKSVQAELLAGGSPARLRAIVGIKQETDPNAERS